MSGPEPGQSRSRPTGRREAFGRRWGTREGITRGRKRDHLVVGPRHKAGRVSNESGIRARTGPEEASACRGRMRRGTATAHKAEGARVEATKSRQVPAPRAARSNGGDGPRVGNGHDRRRQGCRRTNDSADSRGMIGRPLGAPTPTSGRLPAPLGANTAAGPHTGRPVDR